MQSKNYQKLKHSLHQSVERHSLRVGILVSAMAVNAPRECFAKYHLAYEDLKSALISGGFNHDIGKVLLSKELMVKPPLYFPQEKRDEDAYKKHPINAKEIISECKTDFGSIAQVQVSLDMGMFHHERYDGTGFPYGLAGDEIPFAAQLCALANRLDNNMMFCRRKNYSLIPFSTALKRTFEDKGLAGEQAFDCLKQAREEIRELYISQRRGH